MRQRFQYGCCFSDPFYSFKPSKKQGRKKIREQQMLSIPPHR